MYLKALFVPHTRGTRFKGMSFVCVCVCLVKTYNFNGYISFQICEENKNPSHKDGDLAEISIRIREIIINR